MKYELTKDLETGNQLIDNEHRELFRIIQALQDACTQGKGRSQVSSSTQFLLDYVKKHFGNEEQLQKQTNYPGISAHQSFHTTYRSQLEALGKELVNTEANIASLAKLNQMVGTLVSHIRMEDKKLATHIHNTTTK